MRPDSSSGQKNKKSQCKCVQRHNACVLMLTQGNTSQLYALHLFKTTAGKMQRGHKFKKKI